MGNAGASIFVLDRHQAKSFKKHFHSWKWIKKLLVQRIFSLLTLRHQDLLFFPGKKKSFCPSHKAISLSCSSLLWSEPCKGLVQAPRRGDLSLGDVPEVLFVHHPCSRQTLNSSGWLHPSFPGPAHGGKEGKVMEGDGREWRCSHSSSLSLLSTNLSQALTWELFLHLAGPKWHQPSRFFPTWSQWNVSCCGGKGKEEETHLYLQECRNLPGKALGVPCLRFSGIWVYKNLK